jgi:hypothetical protein
MRGEPSNYGLHTDRQTATRFGSRRALRSGGE